MKPRIALFLSLILAATALHGADKDKDKKDKDKDLPPGLRKKENLPPGIAKRRGVGEATTITTNVIVTNVTVTNITVTNLPGRAVTVPTAPNVRTAPRAQTANVDLDRHVRAINTLDNRDAVRRAGMAAIAAETGVTLATLQKQRRDHENIGTAGLLIANSIAAQTKKPVGNYFRQHVEGKPWEKIAADNQVSLENLEAKLARVEDAMRKAK
jgi:hypothetical protein